MANESIALRAKAKSLGIDGYKAMSQDELRTAIKAADKSSGKSAGKTAARKSSPNGRKTGKTAKKAVKTAVKKSAPKKVTKAKPVAKKSPTRKTAVKKAPVATAAKRSSAGSPGRVGIDNTSIDWTAESNVGQSGGNRQVIMKALRSKKGNVQKVYDLLADKAQSMYGKTQDGKRRSKADALTLLRWHISRVKFDFVKDTDQHEGVTRSKAAGGRKAPAKAAPVKRGRPAKKAPQKATRKPARKVAGKRAPAKKSGRKTAKR